MTTKYCLRYELGACLKTAGATKLKEPLFLENNGQRFRLQFDCALSYGLVEYLRTLDMLKEHGWSPSRCIPHGGHQMSLAIAAGLGLGGNESYPDLFQPFGGFPDGVQVKDSIVTLPELPGIGFEGKSDLIKVMRELAE